LGKKKIFKFRYFIVKCHDTNPKWLIANSDLRFSPLILTDRENIFKTK